MGKKERKGTAHAKVQGQEGPSTEPHVLPLGGVFYHVDFTFNCRPRGKALMHRLWGQGSNASPFLLAV